MPARHKHFSLSKEGEHKEENSIVKGISFNDDVVRYRAEKLAIILKHLTGEDVSKNMIVDILYSLYLPNPMPDHETINRNKEYSEEANKIIASPAFQELRQYTVADKEKSEAATVYVLSEVMQRQQQIRDGDEGNSMDRTAAKKLLDKELDGESRKNNSKVTTYTRNGETMAKAPNLVQQDEIDKSIRKGTEKSKSKEKKQNPDGDQQDIETIPGPLWGESSGLQTQERERPELNAKALELLEILKGIPELGSISKTKSFFTSDEYYGYTFSSDVTSTTSSTFAMPDILFDAMFAQSSLPKYQRKVKQAKKATYVLLDKSSSIGDEESKETWSKVTSLALLNLSIKERSDFYLRLFDGEVHERLELLKDAKRSDMINAMNYISSIVPSDGTDIEKGIVAACNDIKSRRFRKISQIILVTDGLASINEKVVTEKLKDAKAELITVYLPSELPDPSATYYGMPIRKLYEHHLETLEKISAVFLTVETLDNNNLVSIIRTVEKRDNGSNKRD